MQIIETNSTVNFNDSCSCVVCGGYVPEGLGYICAQCTKKYKEGELTMEYNETIVDSGQRLEFASGAVRDIQKGKGRCDLVPLISVERLLGSGIFEAIDYFKRTGSTDSLYSALQRFADIAFGVPSGSTKMNVANMLLEVSKHFEAGADKYGEYNWQKGLPIHCYINSAVRHLLKYFRGDGDERHDRAFVWNILCCIWTYINKPELDDFCDKEKNNESN